MNPLLLIACSASAAVNVYALRALSECRRVNAELVATLKVCRVLGLPPVDKRVIDTSEMRVTLRNADGRLVVLVTDLIGQRLGQGRAAPGYLSALRESGTEVSVPVTAPTVAGEWL